MDETLEIPRETIGTKPASDASVLARTWDASAQNIESAMHAILHGVRDHEKFDAEGKAQAEKVGHYVNKGDTVLELGCGIGRIIKHLSVHCRYIYGVDISEKMLAHGANWLRGIQNVELIRCNGKDLGNLPDGWVDFVYSLLVLQHMDKNDAYVYLKEIFRILKDGGRTLLNFPYILSDCFFRDFTYVSLIPQEERDPAKVRSYGKDEVVKIVESVGFSVSDLWVDDYVYVHLKKEPDRFPAKLVMRDNDAAVLDISGWYWLEEKEGFLFRWTRKKAPFFLKIDPSVRALKVVFSCMHPKVNEKGVVLSLIRDQGEVSKKKIRKAGIQEILFPLEPVHQEGVVHFALEVDRTFVPIRDWNRGDDRELGIAVSSIEAV